MNICIITGAFFPELTGVSIHLHNILRHYSKKGCKVMLLCPDYSLEEELYPDYRNYRGEIFHNVIVRPVPSQRNLRRPESVNYQDSSIWNLEDYIGDFRPDIIHVEDPDRIYGTALFGLDIDMAYNNAIGIGFARENKIPIIAFYHTNFPSFADCYLPIDVPTLYRQDPKGVYKKIYDGYNKVLCSCEDARIHLLNHGIDNAEYGVFVGINDNIFCCNLKSTRIPENEKVKLLYCGRFDGGKDVANVIEIFKKAYASNVGIQLFLAGSGFDETMNYVFEECRKNKDILYIGMLDQDELVKVYNSMDIYISPFQTDSFGLSIIEAMSKGLPVITVNKGGPVNLIRDGYNGILCSNEDAIVYSVLKLSGDKSLREIIGSNAREFSKRYYGRNCAENLLEEYKKQIYSQNIYVS